MKVTESPMATRGQWGKGGSWYAFRSCIGLSKRTSWWTTWPSWPVWNYTRMWLGKVWISLALDSIPTISFSSSCFPRPQRCKANPTHLQQLRTLLPAKSPAFLPGSSTTRSTERERTGDYYIHRPRYKKQHKALGLARMGIEQNGHLNVRTSSVMSWARFPHVWKKELEKSTAQQNAVPDYSIVHTCEHSVSGKNIF